MIKEIAKSMAENFIDKSVIEEEESDVYIYGCELFVSEVISTIILLIIGIAMERVAETIIYTVTFTSIRVYAGGYHADSYKKCISIFNICAFLIIITIEWLHRLNILDLVLAALIAANIIIFILAPVEDLNKRLDLQESIRYKKIARKKSLLYSVLFVCIYYLFPFWSDEISYAMIAICQIAVLLILGSIKNHVIHKN